ncbi:hypothetical protein [Arenibaculum sp.]|jgi:microcystin-dependent protein|uniref:hypothetical protein n=1 Tax=Arenibaculum sp. TaxID=2865862 RepID=UPI002E14C0EC|nr:hypothetical protein [Arenibaculum sp.]
MPDLQGRMPMGTGTSRFQEYIWIGVEEGNDSHLLFPENLPHVHDYEAHIRLNRLAIPAVTDNGSVPSPEGNVFAAMPDFYSPDAPTLSMTSELRAYFSGTPPAATKAPADPSAPAVPPVVVTPAGNADAAALPLRPPQMALTACIAVSGTYPQRP